MNELQHTPVVALALAGTAPASREQYGRLQSANSPDGAPEVTLGSRRRSTRLVVGIFRLAWKLFGLPGVIRLK